MRSSVRHAQLTALDLLWSLLRCPICRERASSACGCCSRCRHELESSEAVFTPTSVALGRYRGRLEQAVRAYKFRQHRRLAGVLGRQVAARVRHCNWPLDGVCSVPLHQSRLRQRGFDQSGRLARVVASELGLPYLEPLVRRRSTAQQARLGRTARFRNVAGAFRAAPLRGERLLLLDDVRSTGATLDACRHALLAAGATSVVTAVVASRERAGTQAP